MTSTVQAFDPGVFVWDAWSPQETASLLAGLEAPWYVAGGWALDLFLGEQHRAHGDIEVAVPQRRFHEVVEALAGFELHVITGPGEATPLVHAQAELERTHQTWVREPATGAWRLDVFREPSEADTWICRRDRRIRLPYDEVIEWTDDGIPFGRPEIILLFKAKHADSADRARDQADFATVLPHLEPRRRRWLADALETLHPGHAWLRELGTGRT